MATPDFKPGDVLRAETIADLYRRTEPMRVRGSGGIAVRQGRHGQVQIAGAAPLRFVGVAKGAIPPAAATIGAWGTGKVTRVAFDGTDGYSTGQDFDVVNPSKAAMSSGNGIDDGQCCWVVEDSDGNLIVTPLECS